MPLLGPVCLLSQGRFEELVRSCEYGLSPVLQVGHRLILYAYAYRHCCVTLAGAQYNFVVQCTFSVAICFVKETGLQGKRMKTSG